MKPSPPSALRSVSARSPKVSVLLPTYNRAHVLGRAIDSIRAQTLEDWELIVVDDGSTDETQALMRHYCAKDSRIHYVRQPHFGAPARGLNLGLRLARGVYLHKQDDDDVAYADKLIKCAAALDERTNFFAAAVRWRSYMGTPARGWHLFTVAHSMPLFFRIEAVRASGGWNEFYKLSEDGDLLRRMRSRGGGIVKRKDAWAEIKDILYDYLKSLDENARLHRNLNFAARFYRMLMRTMYPLYHWGLPAMVQPHWSLRRALKQIYFVRRHAFLPSACYAHWRTWRRAVFYCPRRQRKAWEKMLCSAADAPPRFSWQLFWKLQGRLWREARWKCVPLRWRLRNGWSLARYYFAARRQARI